MSLFKRPDGKFVDVEDDQAALASGYTPATEEQYQASKQEGNAAIDSVLSGASMGFGTGLVRNVRAELEGKSRKQVAEEMRLRQEENPNIAMAGKLAGAVGVGLATGGVSGLVGGGIKGMAAEGFTAGLGSIVDESILENKDLTAEKLAMGGAAGALTGAGIGAAFKGVGSLISAVVKKVGGKALGGSLGEAADNLEFETLLKGASAEERAKVEPFKAQILKWGRDNGVIGKLRSKFDPEALARVQAGLKSGGEKIGEQVKRIQEFSPLDAPQRDELVARISDNLRAKFENNPAYTSAVKGTLGDLRDVSSMKVPVTGGGTVNARAGAGKNMTWEDVWDWQKKLFQSIEGNAAGTKKEVLSNVRKTIRDYAMEVAEKANPGQAAAMKAAAAEYRAGASFQDMFERRVAAVENMPGVAQGAAKGAVYAGIYGGQPLKGAVLGGVAGAANKVGAARGGLFTAAAIRSLSEGNLLNGTAANLMRRISTGATEGVLPGARIALETAAAKGANELLAEHFRLASGPDGDAYKASLGLENDTAESDAALSERLAYYHAIQSQAAAVDQSLDSAVGGVLKSSGAGKRLTLSEPMNFDKKSEQIKNLLADPSKVFESIPPELLAAAPGHSGLTAQTLMKGVQYLDSVMPKAPDLNQPEFLRAPWKPSAAALEKWQRSVDAVERPLEVLQMASKGLLTKEHVDAMQAVYPRVYEELKSRIFEELSVWKGRVPYEKRLSLAKMFGPQMLGVSVNQRKVLQMTQETVVGSGQQQGGPDGRQTVDAGKNQQKQDNRTEGQRMEAR